MSAPKLVLQFTSGFRGLTYAMPSSTLSDVFSMSTPVRIWRVLTPAAIKTALQISPRLASPARNNVTTFVYNGSTMPANDMTYSLPDDPNIKSATFRAWCDDDVTLKGQILGQYWNDNADLGNLTMDLLYMVSESKLHQVTSGQVVNGKTTYPINNEVVCSRQLRV